MIVLRLADGSVLVLLPDGQAVRVERGGTVNAQFNAIAGLAAIPCDQALRLGLPWRAV